MNKVASNESFQAWLKGYDSAQDNLESKKETLYQEGLVAFEKFKESNATLLWRLGKAGYQVACEFERKGDKRSQLKMLLEAEKWIEEALEKDSKNSETHKWCAAICGKLTSFVGHREKLERAQRIQVHLEEAIKLNPSDAGLYYSYGRWCIEMAKLTWIEKRIASVVFTTVPNATYEDAIEKLNEADKLRPNWMAINYYIAYCYTCLAKYSEAIKYLDLAANCEVEDEEDKLIEADVASLQKKYAKYR